MKRWSLIISFVLFIALCASAAYWGMQLFKPPTRPVAAPVSVAAADVRTDAAAGLFGGRQGKVEVASNYQLMGVVFAPGGGSVAILSADGKPAQAVSVNAEVQPGVTVKEVHHSYVLLSDGGVTKRVELPESAKNQVNIATSAPTAGSARSPASVAAPSPAPGAGMARSPSPAVTVVPPPAANQPNTQPALPTPPEQQNPGVQPGQNPNAVPNVAPQQSSSAPTAQPGLVQKVPPNVSSGAPPATGTGMSGTNP